LAASRLSFTGPDWIDISAVTAAFEEQNGVVITITGRVVTVATLRTLQFEIQAHDKRYEIGEVPSLASVKCHPGSSQHGSLESAILWSLYQLDGALARYEMANKDSTA
jgi:hypothetical protein